MKRAIFLLLVCCILFLPVDVKAGCNDTELALYRECMIVSELAENILTSPGSYEWEEMERIADYMEICAKFFSSDIGRINDCKRRALGKPNP